MPVDVVMEAEKESSPRKAPFGWGDWNRLCVALCGSSFRGAMWPRGCSSFKLPALVFVRGTALQKRGRALSLARVRDRGGDGCWNRVANACRWARGLPYPTRPEPVVRSEKSGVLIMRG